MQPWGMSYVEIDTQIRTQLKVATGNIIVYSAPAAQPVFPTAVLLTLTKVIGHVIIVVCHGREHKYHQIWWSRYLSEL